MNAFNYKLAGAYCGGGGRLHANACVTEADEVVSDAATAAAGAAALEDTRGHGEVFTPPLHHLNAQ